MHKTWGGGEESCCIGVCKKPHIIEALSHFGPIMCLPTRFIASGFAHYFILSPCTVLGI